jgi:hypothetical protein
VADAGSELAMITMKPWSVANKIGVLRFHPIFPPNVPPEATSIGFAKLL